MMIDLDRFENTPLVREPFEFLVVPEFVKAEFRGAINADYPNIEKRGSFPLSEVKYGAAFGELMNDLNGPQMRSAF